MGGLKIFMNRYAQTNENIGIRYDGKRVLKTTRYPKIPISISDVYIVASETDFLDSLALKFYNDSTLWWIIAQANNIKATLKAPTGKRIRIPQNVQTILSRFYAENNKL